MGFFFARYLTYLFRSFSILFYRPFLGFSLFCYCTIFACFALFYSF